MFKKFKNKHFCLKNQWIYGFYSDFEQNEKKGVLVKYKKRCFEVKNYDRGKSLSLVN